MANSSAMFCMFDSTILRRSHCSGRHSHRHTFHTFHTGTHARTCRSTNHSQRLKCSIDLARSKMRQATCAEDGQRAVRTRTPPVRQWHEGAIGVCSCQWHEGVIGMCSCRALRSGGAPGAASGPHGLGRWHAGMLPAVLRGPGPSSRSFTRMALPSRTTHYHPPQRPHCRHLPPLSCKSRTWRDRLLPRSSCRSVPAGELRRGTSTSYNSTKCSDASCDELHRPQTILEAGSRSSGLTRAPPRAH